MSETHTLDWVAGLIDACYEYMIALERNADLTDEQRHRAQEIAARLSQSRWRIDDLRDSLSAQ